VFFFTSALSDGSQSHVALSQHLLSFLLSAVTYCYIFSMSNSPDDMTLSLFPVCDNDVTNDSSK